MTRKIQLVPSVNKPAYPGLSLWFITDESTGEPIKLKDLQIEEKLKLIDYLSDVLYASFQIEENYMSTAYVVFYAKEILASKFMKLTQSKSSHKPSKPKNI
ncbi:MAG: hypothetical protein R3321_00400 [Nitrososphaeraceae archaeon]|nr:hypothetical protein [Nitrososphaeraceae archaeon]